jgi:hypothetical protein
MQIKYNKKYNLIQIYVYINIYIYIYFKKIKKIKIKKYQNFYDKIKPCCTIGSYKLKFY